MSWETHLASVVSADVGPAQLAAGTLTVHEYQLDGDEGLEVGCDVVVEDLSGALFAARAVEHTGQVWVLDLLSAEPLTVALSMAH